MHLVMLHRLLDELNPRTVVVDPISSLITIGSTSEVRGMMIRLMDTMKVKGINALFTSLTHMNKVEFNDETVNAVSSLADTWIDLKNEERGDDRIRTLLVVKTRGMGHYNNEQEFKIGNKGIKFAGE
jgi:circadian clock protein KaiC